MPEVAEAPAESQVTDPAVAGAGEPGPSSPAETQAGGEQAAVQGKEGDAREALRQAITDAGLDPRELVGAVLELVPEAERLEIEPLKQAAERGAQRERTQRGEAEKAITDREGAFREFVSQAERADQALARMLTRYDRLVEQAAEADEDDPQEGLRLRREAQKLLSGPQVAQSVEAVKQGAIANVALAHSRELAKLRDQHKDVLGQLSGDEEERLRAARLEDARKGTLSEYGVLLEIAVSRGVAKGEQKGEQSGKKSAADTKAAMDRLVKLAEALRLVPQPVNGKRPAAVADERQRLKDEMQAIDVTTPAGNAEWERRQPEFQRRLRALDGKG